MSKAVAKPDEVIGTLNGLIETCRDGQQGFADAHNNLKHAEIRAFCLEQSRNRARFVGELQQEVQHLGGDPENTGSTSAVLHHAWINLKAALGAGDRSIMAACENGEDSAVSEYRKALEQSLPANLHAVIENQYLSVKQSHDRTKQLRDSLDPDNNP